MRSISPDSPLYPHRDQYLSRRWNNKGNSLESLSLILAEHGFHSFVWVMAWVCIQLSYKDQSYSFVISYVTGCPRWLSIADSTSSASLPSITSSFGDHEDPTADLPMERFTLDASGPQSPSIKRFTLWRLEAMEGSLHWKAPIDSHDLPKERFTLGVWALPFTTRFTLCKPFQLAFSYSWKALVGYAPCTYSLYKAAHSLASVDPIAASSSFSPRQVSAFYRSFQFLPFGRNPQAKFCKDLFSFRFPSCTQQRMKCSGFACKSLKKLLHSLNGNYVCFETHTPKFTSRLWRNSFKLPNGMIVFDYSFYGKKSTLAKIF